MWTEQLIDKQSQQKLYVQMYDIIKAKIEKGEWPAGIQIPTEDELCRTYDVSKATVRLAISELVREGYLKRQQGKGTFVSYAVPTLGTVVKTRLTEDMFGEGVRGKKEILTNVRRRPSEDIGNYLKTEDEVFYILSKRIVDNEPACLEETFIPTFLFEEIDSEDFRKNTFYDLIHKKGLKKIAKVVQTIEVTDAKGDIASILKLKEGFPVLLLHRLIISSDGVPIAYVRVFGSGRKYKIQTEFEKVK